MKTRTVWPCPVCGELTWEDSDFIEYTRMESYEWCDCGGYNADFSYGHTSERLGPYEAECSYLEDPSSQYRDFRRGREEAARIDKDLARACQANPKDQAPRLILADWCDEHDMPEWADFWRAQAARLNETVAST